MPENPQTTEPQATDTQPEEAPDTTAQTAETQEDTQPEQDTQPEAQNPETEDAQEEHRDGKRALRQRAQDAEAQVTELTEQLAQRDAHVEELARRLIDQAMPKEFSSTLFWKLREAGTDGLFGDDGSVDRKALHEECVRLDKEYGMHTGVWYYRIPRPDMSTGLTSHGDSASGWGNIMHSDD